MFSIAIIGFFALVLIFFFAGRNDFGITPKSNKSISKHSSIKTISETEEKPEAEISLNETSTSETEEKPEAEINLNETSTSETQEKTD